MYGMLLESVQHFVQLEYGEDVWNHVLREVGHECTVFTTHEIYPDSLIPRIASALARLVMRLPSEDSPSAKVPAVARLEGFRHWSPRKGSGEGVFLFAKSTKSVRKASAETLQPTANEFMMFFGRCFVRYFSNYGYEKLISTSGRHYCDFLESLDYLHQRVRFTYPKMKAMSMQLEACDENGAKVLYKSSRRGFSHYLIGQLQEVAKKFFDLSLSVHILTEEMDKSGNMRLSLRLDFNNTKYMSVMIKRGDPAMCPLPDVDASFLMKLFPFAVLFDKDMKIVLAGDKLIQTWGGPIASIVGCSAPELLRLRKPPDVPFLWQDILERQGLWWEVELLRYAGFQGNSPLDARRGSQGARSVLLKGQMQYITQINAIVFLCSPVFNGLDELRHAGFYINDLNGHGLGRELLLAGWQHCSKIELLYDRTRNRSDSMQQLLRLQDSWKKRGDKLLYSMIPKEIADHLRSGLNPVLACRAYSNLCVIFCALDYALQSGRSPFDAVQDINRMFTALDRLIDSMPVYKVETVGCVYMLVTGTEHVGSGSGIVGHDGHVSSACRAALGVLSVCNKATVGLHVGPAVTGVLGRKVPRYCVIGDTVNTASRMQSSGIAGRAQLSYAAAAALPPNLFRLTSRGNIKVKGKGLMETFWLEGEIAPDEDYGDCFQDMFQN